MKSKLFLFVGVLLCMFSCNTSKYSVSNEKDIVILYENDVHCKIDSRGYEKIAGLRDSLSLSAHTLLVNQGDFISGGVEGAISQGQWVVDIMKKMNYDVVTLGNHEFDIKPYVAKQKALFAQLPTTEVTCLNLCDIKTGENVYAPYVIKQCGSKKIAFIGVLAPLTIEMEFAGFFDENGNQTYTLHPEDLVPLVQKTVNEVREKGADYVIILSHLGDDKKYISSRKLIKETSGIDVVLDGHSHSVLDTCFVNQKGKLIPLSRTGSKFSYIGELRITPNGKITTTLKKPATITCCNQEIQKVTDSILTLRDKQLGSIIGESEVTLKITKYKESNGKLFVCDAYRNVMKADIGIVNSGGLRAEIKEGKISNQDVIAMHPFFNDMCVLTMKGAELKKAFEAILQRPLSFGTINLFVSGMQYGIEKSLDGNTKLLGDITVGEKGNYSPLEDDKEYTIATTSYVRDAFFKKIADATFVEKGIEPMFDGTCILKYFVEHLNGKITESQYPEDDSKLEKNIILKGF